MQTTMKLQNKYRLYATLSFMMVVIIIGIPMWWKTTTVYRVALPSDGIMNINHLPIAIKIHISIFTFNNQRTELLIDELKQQHFSAELSTLWKVEFYHIPYFEKSTIVKTPASLEKLIMNEYNLINEDFVFIEWPKLQEDILLTNERTAFLNSDCSSHTIAKVLNTYVLQSKRIKQILQPEPKDLVKITAPQPSYDIIISVLNPRPDMLDVKWHVKMATDIYLKPYLEKVSHISNYTLKSQWKFQLAFEADLKQVRDHSTLGRHYALGESSLPYIITAIEKNLGVGIGDRTPINLVVYITPCDIAPVYIYTQQNQRAENGNAFISSKWGGIIIINPPAKVCHQYDQERQPAHFYVPTNEVMPIMLYQLQRLLDISVEAKMDRVNSVENEHLAPRLWEYEGYLRRSAVIHITTATNTLQSLIKLLNNISYIVINDQVGECVNLAYESILLAKHALANHQLYNASTFAQRAFVASEKAFFDASLLAQLYFPDEQKYAIYIPLFLPIIVPVLTSFFTMWRLLKKQRTAPKPKLKIH